MAVAYAGGRCRQEEEEGPGSGGGMSGRRDLLDTGQPQPESGGWGGAGDQPHFPRVGLDAAAAAAAALAAAEVKDIGIIVGFLGGPDSTCTHAYPGGHLASVFSFLPPGRRMRRKAAQGAQGT